jgi:hypothetical protein
MAAKRRALQVGQRVAVHRKQRKKAGFRRVELSIPVQDAELLRGIAAILRQGGAAAEALRGRISVSVDPIRSTGGGSLVEFFRRSPLVGLGLDLVRDRSDR